MSKRRSRQADSQSAAEDEILLEMRRPAAMRWLQLGITLVLIALTLTMLSQADSQAITATIVAGVIFVLLCLLARQIWRADANSIRFDGEQITDEAGNFLCRIDQIVKVERGMAMLKPSGGFLLVLNTRVAPGWTPGLWWSYGHRIGVGGTTPTKVAKVMADAVTQAVAARQDSS
ncbi:MAG: hypothetical protein ACPGGK_03270 [Pikeienuella sp.]